MTRPDLETGVVIRYPYLWGLEAAAGETEGRKPFRPTAVGFRIRGAGGKDRLLLFPLTTKPPSKDRHFAELPAIEMKRAGLNYDGPVWIVLDEFNEDSVEDSFYLLPEQPVGKLSKAFLLPLLQEFVRRRRSAIHVKRNT